VLQRWACWLTWHHPERLQPAVCCSKAGQKLALHCSRSDLLYTYLPICIAAQIRLQV